MKFAASIAQPCDEGVICSAPVATPCSADAAPWILAATILGSSLAFIDGSVVNLALPALQANLNATVIDVQWVVEGYGLLLSTLILAGGEQREMSSGADKCFWSAYLFSQSPRRVVASRRISTNLWRREPFKDLEPPFSCLAVCQLSVPPSASRNAAGPSEHGLASLRSQRPQDQFLAGGSSRTLPGAACFLSICRLPLL